MSMRKLSVKFLLLTMLAGASGRLHADTLPALFASYILQDALPDTDLYLLTKFEGYVPRQTLTYSTLTMPTQWSATVSGNYGGTALNVSYLGNSSGYPTGPLTWTSRGAFGAEAWTGSGTGQFTETSPSTFTLDLMTSLAVGAHQGSWDVSVDGTFSLMGSGFGGQFTNTTGVVTIAAGQQETNDDVTFFGFPGQTLFSDIDRDGQPVIINTLPPIDQGEDHVITGLISTVPEPGSLALTILGCIGLLRWKVPGFRRSA